MTSLQPYALPKGGSVSQSFPYPFHPTMLAEVDKLGLLVEGTQPSYIPFILQYATHTWCS